MATDTLIGEKILRAEQEKNQTAGVVREEQSTLEQEKNGMFKKEFNM